jgi:uncharacterized protein YjbI with pentapeptide repeats
LTGADLTDANLMHANLTVANLAGADLTGARFDDANLGSSNGPGNGTAAAATYSDDTICANGQLALFHGGSCAGVGPGW